MSKLVTLGHSFILCLVLTLLRDGNVAGEVQKNIKQHHSEQLDYDHAEGEKLLQESIGVFKGGPESYLLTFAEVRPNKKISVIGEDTFNENQFPPISQNKTNLRRRRGGMQHEHEQEITVSLENSTQQPFGLHAEVQVASGEAEEVVSSILKSTEGTRKNLGVCRKYVPRNFFNPPVDNLTSVVIKNIVGCVEDKLVEDLSCHDCITLHGDLQAFLTWLLHGSPGMACCPPYRRPPDPERGKHYFLFRQEAFGGVKCVTGGSLIPTMCEDDGSRRLQTDIPPPENGVTHPIKKFNSFSNFIRA